MSALPSPAVAALLSLLFPGLGQVYAGARQRGLLLAIPWALLLSGLVYLALSGRILQVVSHAETMVASLVFLLAVLFYHLAAVLDAYVVAARERQLSGAATPRGALVVVAALIALLLVPYGVLEVYGIQANNALDFIARGDNDGDNQFIPDYQPDPASPAPSPSPTATTSPDPGNGATATPTGSPTSGASASPGSTPGTTTPPREWGPIDAAWAENGRLDVLLIGADAGPGRSSVRTDTMILLSVEIETGKAAMFGFPRNMVDVPLPEESRAARPGGIFDDMLSALWRRAAEEPDNFIGSEGVGSECQRDFACERAWRALAGAIQNMAGVQIDGIVSVDLNGFARLVDAVGGIWIDIPAPLVDENYPTEDGTRIRIEFEPGCQKLDGTEALAYARSRHQDSDYHRMRRQQYVLRSIRRQFDPLSLLPRVPELLNIARDNLFMTFSRDDIPLIAEVAARVDADRIHQVRFQRENLRHVTPAAIQQMRSRVRGIFDEPLPDPTPTPSAGQRCPPR